MKYFENRGKTCRSAECNKKARVKGFCMNCYLKEKKKIDSKYL